MKLEITVDVAIMNLGIDETSLKRNIEHFTKNFILNREAEEKNKFALLKVEIV